MFTLFNEIQADKKGLINLSNEIIEQVDGGNLNPLEAQGKIKFISDALKIASDGIKAQVIDELAKYAKGEKATVLGSYYAETREMGVQYDYSECGHTGLNYINKQIEDLTKQKKEIEKFLQGVKKPMTTASDDTNGEEITIYPPIRKSTTTAVFTFINK